MQRRETIRLVGGLDLITPAISLPPGFCIAAQNYEAGVQGYRRTEGYERYDGQPEPHKAAYWVLDFDSGSVEMAEGDTVEGDTSGATGIVLEDATLESGSYGGGDAAGFVVLYNVSGTFQDNEGLEVSAANVATAASAALLSGADDDADDATWAAAAIEARRAVIGQVPGTGPVRGVCSLDGDIYAFRTNVAETATDMYKATAAGWTLQTFGHTLNFITGTAAFAEGDTVTGGTSGATATVERVVVRTGSWGLGTATGYFVLSGITGTFQNAETLTSSAGSATCSGTQAAQSLPALGFYRSITHNFFGAANLRRLYFVNRAGYAQEWDGEVLCPLRVPGLNSTTDRPRFIGVHNNHLLLGYAGGEVICSAPGLAVVGNSASFITTDGAASFSIGQTISGIQSSAKTSTVITGRNKVSYLTGNNATDFVLSDVSADSGAVPDTLVSIGQLHFLDDIGVRSMTSAQEFGDWNIGTVTERIEPLLRQKREAGVGVIGALRVRAKNQYRLFYDDATAITIYFGRPQPECMTLAMGFTPECLHSGEDSDGNEILLAGTDDGWVYRLDVGNSQDGEAIQYYLRFGFMHQGDPTVNKRYHRAILSVANGGPETTITYSSDFSYGDPDQPSGVDFTLAMPGAGGFWDVADWDRFYWDARVQSDAFAELNGIGTNVSLAVVGESSDEESHTLSSMTIFYSPRRSLR